MRRLFRSFAALICGYAVIALVTFFGFPLILGHSIVRTDDPREVAIGTIIAVVAGLLGGWTGTLIGVLRPLANAALVAIPVVLETIYLLAFRTKPEELVHSAVGALFLIASTIAPGALRERANRRSAAIASRKQPPTPKTALPS